MNSATGQEFTSGLACITSVVDPEWFFRIRIRILRLSWFSILHKYFLIFLTYILSLYSRLVSVLGCILWRDIRFRNIKKKKKILIEQFCWEINKFYQFSRVVLYKFISDRPDQEWFFPGPYPDLDTANVLNPIQSGSTTLCFDACKVNCFRERRIRVTTGFISHICRTTFYQLLLQWFIAW